MTIFHDTRDARSNLFASFSIGSDTGFSENFTAAEQAFSHNDRLVSEGVNNINAYSDYIDEIYQATGERLENPYLRDWDQGLSQLPPDQIVRELQFARAKGIEDFHKRAAKLAEGGKFKAIGESGILDRIREKGKNLEARAQDVGARQTLTGAIGSFAGTAVGAFKDPVVAISSLFGAGAASGILRTAVTEAAIGGASEIAIQAGVQSYREKLGLEHGFEKGLENVLSATAGGFVLGAGLKAAPKIFKGAFEAGSKVTGVTREKLIEQFDKLIKKPNAEQAAARDILSQEAELMAQNPGDKTAAGEAEFLDQVREARDRALDGRYEEDFILRDPDINDPNIPPRDQDILNSMVDNRPGIDKSHAGLRTAPESLSDFITRIGGLDPNDPGYAGELQMLLKKETGSSGRRSNILQDTGLKLDDAALRAFEEGFFPGLDRPEIKTFLDSLIDDESGVNKIYRENDPQLDAYQHRQDLEDMAAELGLETRRRSNAELWRQIDYLTSQDELKAIDDQLYDELSNGLELEDISAYNQEYGERLYVRDENDGTYRRSERGKEKLGGSADPEPGRMAEGSDAAGAEPRRDTGRPDQNATKNPQFDTQLGATKKHLDQFAEPSGQGQADQADYLLREVVNDPSIPDEIPVSILTDDQGNLITGAMSREDLLAEIAADEDFLKSVEVCG